MILLGIGHVTISGFTLYRFLWVDGVVKNKGKCVTVRKDNKYIGLEDCKAGEPTQQFVYNSATKEVNRTCLTTISFLHAIVSLHGLVSCFHVT